MDRGRWIRAVDDTAIMQGGQILRKESFQQQSKKDRIEHKMIYFV
jgi:hypothetical protein